MSIGPRLSQFFFAQKPGSFIQPSVIRIEFKLHVTFKAVEVYDDESDGFIRSQITASNVLFACHTAIKRLKTNK